VSQLIFASLKIIKFISLSLFSDAHADKESFGTHVPFWTLISRRITALFVLCLPEIRMESRIRQFAGAVCPQVDGGTDKRNNNSIPHKAALFIPLSGNAGL
jgi:hypothetical protein